MRSTSRRRTRRAIGALVVTIVGAAAGVFVGLIASVVIWNLGWDDSASEEPSIAALMLVAAVVVPITTVAGVATALVLYRRRGRQRPR